MSSRNENLAIDLGQLLGIPAAKVEAALADWLVVRFHRDDVYAAAFARGITLTDAQLDAAMDLVARRFDPDGAGLSWTAIDSAVDEVTGRS